MPITKEISNAGMRCTDREAQVFGFIRGTPNLAFTVSDIVEGLNLERGRGFFDDLVNFMTVQGALDALVKEGKVGGKIIRGQMFYSVP